jgi:hypothetical protein
MINTFVLGATVLKVVIASRMDAMVQLQIYRIRERAEVHRRGHCEREIDEQRLGGEEGPTTIVDIRGQEEDITQA